MGNEPSTRRYAGRSAGERAAERRGRLVDATVDLLGGPGEQAVTVRAVCAGAGLTERYFYESFPGRDDALVAALDSVTSRIGDAAVVAVAADAGWPEERVLAGLRAVVDLVADEPAVGRVALVESAANPALRRRRHAVTASLAEVVAAQARVLYGDDEPGDVRLRGTVYVAGVAELLASWLGGELDVARDELVDTAATLFGRVMRG